MGDRVTIKSGVQLWDGLRIEDDVHIGPNATFTNVKFPRSKAYPDNFPVTTLEKGASIGGGAVILPGLAIGETGHGWCGSSGYQQCAPARHRGWQPGHIIGYVETEMNIDLCKIIDLPKIPDPRGNLTFVESNNHIPFDIQRVYYLYDVPGGSERGGHAHKELHQLIIAMSGSFDVVLDDGKGKNERIT